LLVSEMLQMHCPEGDVQGFPRALRQGEALICL